MSSSAPPVGLARLPRRLRALLDQAAADLTARGNALERAAEGRVGKTEPSPLAEGSLDAFRRAIADELTVGPERGDLLRVADALDELLHTIRNTREALPLLAEAVPGQHLIGLTSIVRDLVRTTTASIALIEREASAREPLHARAHELADELRAGLRAAQLEVIEHAGDPLATVRGTALLRRLRAIGNASARAMRSIEILAGQHS